MEEVDQAFIQAVEHRPKPSSIFEADEIPIIDLSSTITSDNTTTNDITGLICEIGEACKKWGFFHVINHGFPLEKLKKIEVAAREFFALPIEEKRKVSRDEANPLGYFDTEHTKNVRDWKQVFDFTAKDPIVIHVAPGELQPKEVINRWPAYPSELREVGQEYAREVEKLAFKLMELIALSLGLAVNRLIGFFKDDTSYIRLNHYPTCPSPHLALGVGRHKDAGALTILAQDSVGGLEVRRKSDGEWVRIKPIPGAFTINIGDILQVWSNNKYESVEHRAMVNSDKDRLSIPFFLNPSHYVMVKPLEEFIDKKEHAKYNEYNWRVFFATREKTDSKKFSTETIQISHFKITE